MSRHQVIGNVCVALAALIFLLPLRKLLRVYAHEKRYVNGGERAALFILIPLWLLLVGALLGVTASGGFDWLRLGRPTLYALSAAATLALGVASFGLVAFFLRPGFIPQGVFLPPIYCIFIATMLVAVLGLNPQLAPGVSPQVIRLPWTLGAALSLLACIGLGGYLLARSGRRSVTHFVRQLRHRGPAEREVLAKISTLDPQADLSELLGRATRYAARGVREAAIARLRSHPQFLEMLTAELESGHVEPAVTFLECATLTAHEKKLLARPARRAMERWVDRIPAPNYTTKKHLNRMHQWGAAMFRVLKETFADTGVDFDALSADFEARCGPTKRRDN
ncbi:MAG: hypothetical protein R3F49_21300 [Planctomycetota bacterium]